MTSFGWKRKRALTSSAAEAFTQQQQGEGGKSEEHGTFNEDGVDWLSAAKRRRTIKLLLEDSTAKSKRLRNEGAVLAENERYWEAIKHWDEALQLTPDSAALYEMKSQALLEVGEVFPAVEVAEKAVHLDPTWAVARQTLGRAQLGLGEVEMWKKDLFALIAMVQVSEYLSPGRSYEAESCTIVISVKRAFRMALKSFQKALHLDPANQEMRDEDLKWAQELVERKKTLKSELESAETEERPDINPYEAER